MNSIIEGLQQLFLSDDKIKALELLGHIYKCEDCGFYHISPTSSWANVEAIIYYGVFNQKG